MCDVLWSDAQAGTMEDVTGLEARLDALEAELAALRREEEAKRKKDS